LVRKTEKEKSVGRENRWWPFKNPGGARSYRDLRSPQEAGRVWKKGGKERPSSSAKRKVKSTRLIKKTVEETKKLLAVGGSEAERSGGPRQCNLGEPSWYQKKFKKVHTWERGDEEIRVGGRRGSRFDKGKLKRHTQDQRVLVQRHRG